MYIMYVIYSLYTHIYIYSIYLHTYLLIICIYIYLVGDSTCSPEVLLQCCQTHEMIAKLVACFQLFEVECLNEIDDMQSHIDAGVDWHPGFIVSCFLEYEMFFLTFLLQ